jgi:hypothetical protein
MEVKAHARCIFVQVGFSRKDLWIEFVKGFWVRAERAILAHWRNSERSCSGLSARGLQVSAPNF